MIASLPINVHCERVVGNQIFSWQQFFSQTPGQKYPLHTTHIIADMSLLSLLSPQSEERDTRNQYG